MFSIFHIEGGIGKNILATSVVSSLKSSDPERKIILVTAWPQVWFNNPDVYQVYPIGQAANFYKNFIKDKDTEIYRIDPYHHQDYILNKKHLIDVWCDICGIKNIGITPKLYFSPLELEFIKLKITNGVQKPILLIHPNGGGYGPNARPYSWYRDIPYQNVKDVVDYFKNDYHVYQIGYDNQNLVEGANKLTLETREILAAPLFSRKRLFIDSFTQHASVSLDQKSVVCWVGNDPNVLGYNTNINIKPNIQPVYDTLHSSYLDDFDIGGNPIQFPYDRIKIFDSNEIINKLISL
jgi:hypothetical protein